MKAALISLAFCIASPAAQPAFADEYTDACHEPADREWRAGYSVWKPVNDAYLACLDAGFERRHKDEAERLARLRIDQEARKLLRDTFDNGVKAAVRNAVARGINERAGMTVIKETPASKALREAASSFEVALAVPAIGGEVLSGNEAPDPAFKMIDKLDTKMYSLGVPDPFASDLFKTNLQIAERINTQVFGQFSSISELAGNDRSWASNSSMPIWAAAANTITGNSFDEVVAASVQRADAEAARRQRAAESERRREQTVAANAAREKRREIEREEDERQDRLERFRELRAEREALARLSPPPVFTYAPVFVPSASTKSSSRPALVPSKGKDNEVGCNPGPCRN